MLENSKSSVYNLLWVFLPCQGSRPMILNNLNFLPITFINNSTFKIIYFKLLDLQNSCSTFLKNTVLVHGDSLEDTLCIKCVSFIRHE